MTVDGRSASIPVALADCAGAVAQIAVAALALEQRDLTGAISCAWQLSGPDGVVDSNTPALALDTDATFTLERVENRIAVLVVEVRGGDTPVRFRAPVALAQPAGALVAHLRAWLNLGEGNWHLSVEGSAVEAHMLLVELNLEDGDEMVVRS